MALRLGPTVRSNTHTLTYLWEGPKHWPVVLLQCEDPSNVLGFDRFLEQELGKVGIKAEISSPPSKDHNDPNRYYVNAVFVVEEVVDNPLLFLRSLNRKKIFSAVDEARRRILES